MKTKLLLSVALLLSATLSSMAQDIKNGSFENWSVTAIDNPDGWVTSNTEQGGNVSEIVIKKVTGQSGSAIQLITETTSTDTIFGFFNLSQGDPTEGEGGKPYSQKPDSITGYYKCDLKAGDSAILIVIFKKNGAVISTDIFKFTGTKTNFTRFAYKLSLSATPDSMIIAGASSNVIANMGVKPGSTITFDELAFKGTGITQTIPNGNFDSWTTDTLAKAEDWFGAGLGLTRTNDAYKGNYATLLTSQDYGNGFVSGAIISNSDLSQQGIGPRGGMAYSSLNDTLVFYYKYSPSGTDTASVGFTLYKNGNIIGGNGVNLFPTATYSRVEVPIIAGSAPDTMVLVFVSSNFPNEPTNAGSKLYIDEVQLKSQPLNTGIFTKAKNNMGITAYPNPVADKLTIELNNAGNNTVQITDLLGRVITQQNNINNYLQLDTQNWPQGVYLITITTDTGWVSSGKVIKK